MAFLFLSKLAITLAALCIARRIYWEVTTGNRRRALARKHGCLSANFRRGIDPLLSLDQFLGNIRAYREHRFLEWWARSLSDSPHTQVFKILGQHVFLTDDPENIKSILATKFDSWSLGRGRITQMSAYLGKGIFTTEGAAWKHSRDMLRPCFERSQVADVSVLEKHTQRLIAILPEDGTTVDLQPLFHQLTLDIATDLLFGRSTDALAKSGKDKEVEEFIEAFEYCQNPFRDKEKSRFAVLAMFLPDPKFKKCASLIRDFTDNMISLELSNLDSKLPSERYIFLHSLIAQTQDRAIIRSELLNILLAGRDTTASLLSNLIWELSRTPPLDMKYLRALINESQRMYPIVPSNEREALHDNILPRGGGSDGSAPILVPKGCYVAFHTWSLHRRPDIYGPDAHVFNPDRWLNEENPLRPGWAYIPFSGGPRVCIGQNFALTETMFVVVRLLQFFEFESRDYEPWREKLSVTCSGLGGCK
ncbi:cytochrome P450 [Corynespora cassiicola Philippines]|uniref:Cytochrome P450 n=1 Tax=Corynespora cassiicola Philippines TaxID=1448308 RepID=A0A2T2N6R2_CORCC|nr:cytochrome P450 [Corynespora cassiicola Philippines]